MQDLDSNVNILSAHSLFSPTKPSGSPSSRIAFASPTVLKGFLFTYSKTSGRKNKTSLFTKGEGAAQMPCTAEQQEAAAKGVR